MRDDAVIRLASGRERERIGRRAAEGEEHFALRLENLADEIGSLARPFVFAVGGTMAGVGFLQCLPGFRADTCVIIAGEVACAFWGGGHNKLIDFQTVHFSKPRIVQGDLVSILLPPDIVRCSGLGDFTGSGAVGEQG